MKKIKRLIIFLIIIVIILIVGILVMRNNKDTEVPDYTDEDRTVIEKTKPQKETGNGNYLLIDQIVNNYFLYVGQKNENIDNTQAVLSVLDQDFEKKYEITQKNVFSKLNEYTQFNNYGTKEIYTIDVNQGEGTLNSYFYVKGVLRNNGNIQNVFILVKKDDQNSTFSITPISEDEYNTTITTGIENDIQTFSITENGYNKIEVKTATDYEMCLKHMQDYKNAVNNNIQEAYDRLDDEYKKQRFGTIEKFKQYRENKQEIYGKENFTQYMVNDKGTYKQYVCKDMYGNLYVFEETVPMEYALKLDTYTILTDEFKKEYDTEDSQKKVQMNLNRFILMINNQDYEAAYSVLDSDFKNNYFKNIEDFEKYIKTYAYRYNNMKIDSFDIKGNVYSCSVSLGDSSNGVYVDEEKGTGGSGYVYNWDFYMQLGENYDFTISFEVQK